MPKPLLASRVSGHSENRGKRENGTYHHTAKHARKRFARLDLPKRHGQ